MLLALPILSSARRIHAPYLPRGKPVFLVFRQVDPRFVCSEKRNPISFIPLGGSIFLIFREKEPCFLCSASWTHILYAPKGGSLALTLHEVDPYGMLFVPILRGNHILLCPTGSVSLRRADSILSRLILHCDLPLSPFVGSRKSCKMPQDSKPIFITPLGTLDSLVLRCSLPILITPFRT